MSADPFANTTTVKNILQHVISPKIVSDGTGGYTTKTDLVNVHNLVFSERATSRGTVEIPLTAQCGTYTLPTDDIGIVFHHSRVTANSVIIANVMTSGAPFVISVVFNPSPRGFTVYLNTAIGTADTRIGWFIASF
jgi:hypothetical protein